MAALLLVLLSAQAPAAVPGDAAQDRAWVLEIYAGGATGAGSIDGAGQLPPAGPVLVESFQGVTRSIPTFPSWFFGAGAAYLNEGLDRRGLRIDPLDRVLTTASAAREGGGTIGVRVSRRIAGRARLEFAAEHARRTLTFSPEARDQLEKTRASFATLFTGLTTPFVSFAATSTASVEESGSATALTGALTVDLLRNRRLTPFALVGAGLASRSGETSLISLTGRYAIDFGQFIRAGIAQGDNVAIRYSSPKHVPVMVLGGGLRYSLSRRLVARVDAKASLTRDRLTVSVDANPTTESTTPQVTGGLELAFFPPPFSLHFNSSPSATNSLRGPAFGDVVTFSGSSLQARFNLSAGLGWKF